MNWLAYAVGVACGGVFMLGVCAAWFVYTFKDVMR